jgi:hypothetical protein
MSEPVATTASTITCGHPKLLPTGKVEVASTAKLRVSSNPVLFVDSIERKVVTPLTCGIVVAGQQKKCTKVEQVDAGSTAEKLLCGGSAVVLASKLSGTTDGVPAAPENPKQLSASSANQTKLTSR